VHPARYEPFGLAPLEAACSGAALVLGRIDSLREIWGEDALYVEPDDAAELCAAVTRLVEDPILRHRSAARAEARARGMSSRRMADAYTALYLELASAGDAHRSSAARAGALS
jgi:glycosyltransferase involved in cell wall biosynthesis